MTIHEWERMCYASPILFAKKLYEIPADVVVQVTGIHCPRWRRHRLPVCLGGQMHAWPEKERNPRGKSTICLMFFSEIDSHTSIRAVL